MSQFLGCIVAIIKFRHARLLPCMTFAYIMQCDMRLDLHIDVNAFQYQFQSGRKYLKSSYVETIDHLVLQNLIRLLSY